MRAELNKRTAGTGMACEPENTSHVALRSFMKSDITQVHALFCDEEAMRMVGMYPPFTRLEETTDRICQWMNSGRYRAITREDTGELIGYIAVNPDSEEGRADARELGFALISKYRGQGYMKEAVNIVLNELAEEGIAYVWACCFKENAASERLIRSMGFEFQGEGTFYSQNDREYESLEFRMSLKNAL